MDVEAETLLIAFERIDTVRNPEAFLGFVFTIARRVCTKIRKRGTIFRSLTEEDGEQFVADDRSPEVSAEVRLLYDALARLPVRQREAVILFEIVGLPLEEIREIQSGTLSGVKSRVTRGRQNLTEFLAPEKTARRQVIEKAQSVQVLAKIKA
jgi:RNA polymerase sigma-70 factor (ECF subfamily)